MPSSTHRRAAATWSGSSCTRSRTRTLVSTARMALRYVLPDSVLQFGEGSRLGRLVREKRGMNILPIVLSRPPHHYLPAFFVPLDDRPRTHAQPASHLGRYRDLSLRGDL